ncbi:hypothetical protein [Amycolatopsis sp. NPDC059657]|uniref:hypothetical protein n=1 Tax=Amycolatopsis sp. NPDC059657 TaxID=3346899 RepID=UPI0036726E28
MWRPHRTCSAGLAALTYTLTYLPDVFAGPLLSGLADRWPRRTVIVADVLRALLVAVMAIPPRIGRGWEVTAALRRAELTGTSIAVLIRDIDGFKQSAMS